MYHRFHLNFSCILLLFQVLLNNVVNTEAVALTGSTSTILDNGIQRNGFDNGDEEDSTTIEIARNLVPSCASSEERAGSFVLLFMGHSGSTALISALQQHSNIYVTGFEPLDHGSISRDTNAALEYADDFFTTGANRKQIAGFKIRPYHILKQPKKWTELFQKHKTRVIWNYRSNIFKQAVGHWPILYLNDKSAYEGLKIDGSGHKRKVNSFEISDSIAFHKLLSARWRGEQEVEKAIASLGSNTCILPISYELLLEEPNKAFFAMQYFLGIQINNSIHAQRLKVTSDNLCHIVTNWNNLCNDFFLCTRWRPMMDDTINGCTCPVSTGIHTSRWRQFCEPEHEHGSSTQFSDQAPAPTPAPASPPSQTKVQTEIQHAPRIPMPATNSIVSDASKLVIEWNLAIAFIFGISLVFGIIIYRVYRSGRRRR